MGKAEWVGKPVCWWLDFCFCFVCCLDEVSCTGWYWWLDDANQQLHHVVCIHVVSFVWVLTIWCSLGLVLEKAMAPHSSTLAWRITWMEEPGRLQSMGSLSVGHDWAVSLSLFIFMHWRRKWQPTPVFLLGESQERGALWVAVYGVTLSRTQLKRLSSSSSSRVSSLVV